MDTSAARRNDLREDSQRSGPHAGRADGYAARSRAATPRVILRAGRVHRAAIDGAGSASSRCQRWTQGARRTGRSRRLRRRSGGRLDRTHAASSRPLLLTHAACRSRQRMLHGSSPGIVASGRVLALHLRDGVDAVATDSRCVHRPRSCARPKPLLSRSSDCCPRRPRGGGCGRQRLHACRDARGVSLHRRARTRTRSQPMHAAQGELAAIARSIPGLWTVAHRATSNRPSCWRAHGPYRVACGHRARWLEQRCGVSAAARCAAVTASAHRRRRSGPPHSLSARALWSVPFAGDPAVDRAASAGRADVLAPPFRQVSRRGRSRSSCRSRSAFGAGAARSARCTRCSTNTCRSSSC